MKQKLNLITDQQVLFEFSSFMHITFQVLAGAGSFNAEQLILMFVFILTRNVVVYIFGILLLWRSYYELHA